MDFILFSSSPSFIFTFFWVLIVFILIFFPFHTNWCISVYLWYILYRGHHLYCHQFFSLYVHMLTMFYKKTSIQIKMYYFHIIKTFICFCNILLYPSTSLFTPEILYKSCLCGKPISILFVWLFVLTNFCIHLIPFLVSFFSSSPEPTHILSHLFFRCRRSALTEFVIVSTSVPGFTNPWIMKSLSRPYFI